MEADHQMVDTFGGLLLPALPFHSVPPGGAVDSWVNKLNDWYAKNRHVSSQCHNFSLQKIGVCSM